jgi:hypothetical protein
MQKVETAQPGFAGGVELARAEARGHRVSAGKSSLDINCAISLQSSVTSGVQALQLKRANRLAAKARADEERPHQGASLH